MIAAVGDGTLQLLASLDYEIAFISAALRLSSLNFSPTLGQLHLTSLSLK